MHKAEFYYRVTRATEVRCELKSELRIIIIIIIIITAIEFSLGGSNSTNLAIT
jgi:hypothetical protein